MERCFQTYISFYLRPNRIHIFIDALRWMGCPKRICFMISENGNSLLIAPYAKKDFKSHPVPHEAYVGTGVMEVSSLKLCRLIAKLHHWQESCSYRVPGMVWEDRQIAIFDLTNASRIGHEDE